MTIAAPKIVLGNTKHLSVDDVVFCLSSNDFNSLHTAYTDGRLSRVNWSWVIRKIAGSYTLEQLYLRITGAEKPICVTCQSNPVAYFKSFKDGFNKYCSRTCAAKDPSVIASRNATIASDTNNRPNAIRKMRDTNTARYGGASPISNPTVLQKRRQTNVSRYGSAEVLGSKSRIREKITLDIAAIKVFSRLAAYTHITPLFDTTEFSDVRIKYEWKCNVCDTKFTDDLFCGNIPKCHKCNPRSSSIGEREMFEFVSSLLPGIEVKSRHRIGKTEIDIFIPSLKVGIEYNGMYWHSDAAHGKTARTKTYHLDKKLACVTAGVDLIQFWESQWVHQRPIVESVIRNRLHMSSYRYYARRGIVREISAAEASTFLNANHLGGDVRSASIRLGLFDTGTLVFVMTFGTSRFGKPDEMEILRMCSALNTTVVGAASKVLKFFLNLCHCTHVVSFCNNMLYNGTSYQEIGFTQVTEGSIAAWYFDASGILQHRFGFQKHKLLSQYKAPDKSLTAWELAQGLGYNRVWDAGSSKWELRVP